MGASDFHASTSADGQSLDAAFTRMVQNAQHDYGHAGYSGTIAEKDGYRFFETKPNTSVYALINAIEDSLGRGDEEVLERLDPFIAHPDDMQDLLMCYDDKWGEAVAVKVKVGGEFEYHFFGYASS